MKKRPGENGQILVGVIIIVVVLAIMIPALVSWVQQDVKTSIKDRRTTTAFNLAMAAVERGYWKVKGSTGNVADAMAGVVLTGYNFDVTYTDISGGSYRIQISSAGNQSVTIVGEGRDDKAKETRAISAVYKNQVVYSPLLAQGKVGWSKGLGIFWGPIMSQGDIQLQDDFVANWYFPRKFAKGVVSGTAANPRDTNGLAPPNTDNIEWWSNYQYVPELPLLDFATMRASAAATGTLNLYGCKSLGGSSWDKRASCTNTGAHSTHFSASWNHPKSPHFPTVATSTNNYVWYYDGDLVLGGDTTVNGTYGVGLWGTLIVRGNLTLDANGDYNYTGNVPVNAWMDEHKLTKTTFDTAASGEYPADLGLNKTNTTFKFGTDSFCVPAAGCGWINTVGRRGFTYVGGNLTITNNGFMDFNGAVWVNGSVIASGASQTTFCGVLFDDQLTLPTLNVILVQQSWKEVSPSPTAWH